MVRYADISENMIIEIKFSFISALFYVKEV